MKALRVSFALLAVCCAAFAVDIFATGSGLPERVATHFGFDGVPNGWMTRGGWVKFSLAMGVLVPGFIVGMFAVMRRNGGKGLNIPRREYWLAPERKEETLSFVQRQGSWFAIFMVGFFAGVNHLIIAANQRQPVGLTASDQAWLIGVFLVAMTVWAVGFLRHFHRRPA